MATRTKQSSIVSNAASKKLKKSVSNISEPKVQSSIFGTASNIVNSLVGSGIVGFPYALKETGFVAGIIFMLLAGYFVDKSHRMLVETAAYNPKLSGIGVTSFEDMMKIPFGKPGYYYILASLMIVAYGLMVSYLLIIKQTLPTVIHLNDSTVFPKELVLLVSSVIIILPLSLLRDISQLAFASILSIAADLFIVAIVTVMAPIKETVSEAGGLGDLVTENWMNRGVFVGLGIFSVAFACQHTCFLNFGTLQNKTPERWATTVHLALTFSVFLHLLLGVVGYLGFVDETQANILNNFDSDFRPINAARGLLAVTMFLTFPLALHGARMFAIQIFFNGNMDNTTVDEATGEEIAEKKFSGALGRRELWTIYIFILALVPAIVFDDLGMVLSLTGSTGSSSIAFVGPGLAYLGINGELLLTWTNKFFYRKDMIPVELTNDDGVEEVEPSVSHHYFNNDSISVASTTDDDLDLVLSCGEAASQDNVENTRTPNLVSRFLLLLLWWCLGFPIWTKIAQKGAANTFKFLHDFHRTDDDSPTSKNNQSRADFFESLDHRASIPQTTDNDNDPQQEQQIAISINPTAWDFFMSIVFLCFGVVAVVAGVASNFLFAA